MGITSWALGDQNYKTLQDLEAEYSAKYPGMDTSGGVFSDARHAAATNLMSDRLGGGWLGDTAANIGGAAREVPTFVSEAMGLTPSGQSWEDLKANTLAYDYGKGTSAADIYADVFSKYDQSQKAALSNPNYAYGTAQAGHDDWVPKKTGPDPFMATPYLMSKASNLGQSAMHSTPTYDTSDSYLYSTSSGEPVPLPPQLRKPETNWYDGIMNALNPSKADVLARLQANNPAFKGDYYTSRQPSGPWDTGEWGPGPKSDLSDPSGDAFDFEFKGDRDFTNVGGLGIANEPDVEQVEYLGTPSKFQNFKSKMGDMMSGIGGMFKKLPTPMNLLRGAVRNPLDPKSPNFNPMLQSQLEDYSNYVSQTGNDPLAGQNLVSGFGSNDIVAQLRKRLARIRNRKIAQTDSSKTKQKQIQAAIDAQTTNTGGGGYKPGDATLNWNPNIQKTGPTYGPHKGGGAKSSPKSSPKGYSSRSHSGGNYGGQHHWARGGRVGYGNGGLATLFTRRG